MKRKPAILHVSTQGNDAWSGLGTLPDLTGGGPLATPGQALRQARRLSREGRRVEVRLAGGVYELDRPLLFTPADSGQVWAAEPGERPVLSGGRRLSGWLVGEHQGRPCWSLDLPEVRAGLWNFTQLWVDGGRRPRPSLPKSGFHRFAGLDGQADSGFNWHHGPDRATYLDDDIRRFRNLADVTVVAYQHWFDAHLRISSVDEQQHLVHFTAPAIGSLRDETGAFARYVLVNVAEALSEPGEWYLDRPSGRLLYLPKAGETPETVTVTAPRLSELVRFQGSATATVTDLRLEHLVLAHNEWSRPPNQPGTVQAAFDVPGAVLFDRAERCVIYGCELAHCAGYAVEMLAGCHGNVVAACSIHDLGAGGVKIGHESLTVHEAAVGQAFTAGRGRQRTMAATVVDCHLHDGGLVYPSAIGIWIGNAGYNRIQHNHIHHFPYTGISFGWMWGYAATRTVDNRIERNHIHHINHERLLSDNGGIYSLGIQPGSSVVGNHLHDIACHGYGGWGIYPDEGSSGIRFQDNLVHDVQYCGFSVHYGRFLTVRNNVFARMERAMLNPGRADLSCGLVFERNLVWFDRDNLKADTDWDPVLCATRNNLLWNAATGGVAWQLGSLAAEQAAGRWLDSCEADPGFVDPASGDFTLREGSPALALGFRPLRWDLAGPRRRSSLPASYGAYRLPAAAARAVLVARVDIVSGAEDGSSIQARITVSNPGPRALSGTYRVVLAGIAGRREQLIQRLPVRVPAGGTVERVIACALPPGGMRAWLMARGDERRLYSGAARLIVPARLILPRLPAATAAKLEVGVAQGLAIEIVHSGHRLLNGRAAVVGDAVAVTAEVTDSAIRPDRNQPWNGSVVELFLAPEPDAGMTAKPAQFFILPPDAQPNAQPGELRAAAGGLPAGYSFSCQAIVGGWRFSVLLPLRSVGIANPAGPWRFDLICAAASPVAGQNQLRLPCWGTSNDHADSRALARVEVAP